MNKSIFTWNHFRVLITIVGLVTLIISCFHGNFIAICFLHSNSEQVMASRFYTWHFHGNSKRKSQYPLWSPGKNKSQETNFSANFEWKIISEMDYWHQILLTHWGWDKMDAISQTTFSSAFSWIKMFEFQLKFHWSLFLRVQLTLFHHWFR